MQGHNFQIDKEPLLALPINAPDKSVQQRIAKLVDKVIDRRKDVAASTTEAEKARSERLLSQSTEELELSIAQLYMLSSGDREALSNSI